MLVIGFLLALAITYPAYRRGSLSLSGLVLAVLVGTVIAWRGGLAPALALYGFFLTSSALSRLGRRTKEALAREKHEKGDRRDGVQVLANGGVAALCCLLAGQGGLGGSPLLMAAALGSLAAAAADTWATEIGVLSSGRPRHLLTLRPVPTGTSGAVSIPGLIGMGAGALFIALLAALTGGAGAAAAVFVAGVAGGMVDSLLGATVQERRSCPGCGAETEQRRHSCGAATRVVAGLPGLDNDGVNLLATASGAVIAALLR